MSFKVGDEVTTHGTVDEFKGITGRITQISNYGEITIKVLYGNDTYKRGDKIYPLVKSVLRKRKKHRTWFSLVKWDPIKMFGFWDGLGFIIRMDITDPIKMWYWETFKTRPYCMWAGWYCKDPECKHTHLEKPPRPEDYPIQKGDMCDYCGEEPAVTHTHNPNTDQKPYFWKVCDNCDEIIPLQEQQALHAHMMMTFPTEGGKDHAEQCLKKTNRQIEDFEKRTGKKTACIGLAVTESGRIDAREIRNHSGDDQ